MASQYTLDNDFAAISETQGTLYNVSDSAIELASASTTTKGQGILLRSGEKQSFRGTVYARSMDAAATLNVSDFTEAAGGGDQPVLRFCGTVSTYADLPASPEVGDVYNVETADAEHGILAGDNVAWDGTAWDRMAGVYAVMTGATASTAGAAGLVPAPTAGQEAHILTGGGSWALPYGFREPSTAYTAGALALCGTLSTGLVLRCTTAGTTAASALDCSSASLGDSITDGTAVWTVEQYVVTQNNAIPTSIYIPGAFNRKVTFTTSGSYTAPVTGTYRITLQGGGGGGGGAGTTTSSVHGSGGGGGQGANYTFYETLTAGTSYSYVIGAGGAFGTAGSTSNGTGGNGTVGGNSSITIGSNIYKANGGDGGYSYSNFFRGGTAGAAYKNSTYYGVLGAAGTGGCPCATNSVPGGTGGGVGGTSVSHTGGGVVYPGGSGAGGAGGEIDNTGTYYDGSAGGNGYIAFEYYNPTA